MINDYVGVFGQPQEFYTRAKADHLRRILDAKGGTKTLDVLDIGCGHGLIHSYLRDAGCRLTGIDVAENAIEMARRRNPHVHYDVYDGSRLPYADGTFDVLFTIGVIWRSTSGILSSARRAACCGQAAALSSSNTTNSIR